MSAFSKLLDFIRRLDDADIYYELKSIREDSIMVYVVVPGEQWEVEFFEDGHLEIEKFKSDGHLYDELALAELFEKFSD